MPPDQSTAQEWLNRAKSNLARARQPKAPDIFWEDLCFDAQQAVEKALKAVLIAHGISFRFVHDIAELLTNLKVAGFQLSADLEAAAGLTDYAVEMRYPGASEPATEDEYRQAVGIAADIVRWAETQIGREKTS